MDKIAQLKHAEVAGVISGLIDGGYIKVASDDDFEALTGAVANSISDNWDLNEVLDKTAEVMEYVGEASMDKTAEEQITDALAEYGYLSIMKEAGEISDVDFEKQATAVSDVLKGALKAVDDGAIPVMSRFKDVAIAAGKKAKDAASFKELQYMLKNMRGVPAKNKAILIAKALKDPAKLYGGAAGTGAGLYGLNKLRDKDNRDAIAKKFKAGKKAILG